MTTSSDVVPGFASLSELQEKHAELVKEVAKDMLAPGATWIGSLNSSAGALRLAQFWTRGPIELQHRV